MTVITTSPRELLLRKAIQSRAFMHMHATQPIIEKDGTRPLPWLFDLKALMFNSRNLDAYAELFWERYEPLFPFQVCGIELSGIPLVTAIVMKGREHGRDVNGLFVRKSRKKDGLMKVLEGDPNDLPVIFVDDLINSGRSLERSVTRVRAEGLVVAHACVILALRELSWYDSLAHSNNVTLTSLFTAAELGLPEAVDPPMLPTSVFDVRWKFAAPNPGLHHVVPKSAPVADESHVFMGSDNGTMYALDKERGDIAWTYRVGRIPFRKGIFSTPLLYDGKLYFGAYDGNCYALDARTGTRVWLYRDADWIGSSPAIAPDLGVLYIGLEFGLLGKRGGIAALSLSSGKEVWVRRDMSDFTHSSPLYVAQECAVFIGNNNGDVYCLDAKNGALRWRFYTGGPVKASFAYDSRRRVVVFGSFDGTVYGLYAKNGTVAWTHTCGEAIFATPLIHGDMLFMPCLDKCLYALALKDGALRWKFETRGRIFASPVIAAGSLWIGSNDGALYELDPHSGAPRARFQTTERIVNAITHDSSSRSLFVPTQANELYCIRKQPTD